MLLRLLLLVQQQYSESTNAPTGMWMVWVTLGCSAYFVGGDGDDVDYYYSYVRFCGRVDGTLSNHS